METREIKLAKGTLRVTRNAQILHTIAFGGVLLASSLPLSGLISNLTYGTNLALGFYFAEKAAITQGNLRLFNESDKSIKPILINQIANFKINSNIWSIVNVGLGSMYFSLAIKEQDIIKAGTALSFLSSSLAYAKASSLRVQLVAEQEKVKTLK